VLRHLRWQLVVAVAGVLAIAALLLIVSSRSLDVRPAAGGQLVEAMVGPPATLNPLFASTEAEADLTALLFPGLTRLDSHGLVQPDLATWVLSPDGRTYRFTLRPGVTWHDGQPVTSDDVVLTARLAASDAIPVQKNPLVAAWRLAEVRKVDDRVVDIVLKEPFAPFLPATSLGLVPAHVLADVAPADLPRHRFSTIEPVGAGGYRILQPGGLDASGARLVRFDPYWSATGRPRPYLDELYFRFYPTRAAAREALGQRQVHAMGRVPPDTIQTLGSGAALYNAVEAGYTLIYLNPENVLFADPTMRQALSLGLDRVGLIQDPNLLNGQGIPAGGPIPPGSWAYAPDQKPPNYDPVQARRILEQAGWIDSDGDGVRDRDGKPLAFDLAVSSDPLAMGLADRVREDWAALGVDATVQQLDQQSMVNSLRNRTHEAVLFGVNLAGRDPDPYPLWHSSQIQGGDNFAGWNNPEVDRLLTEARQPDASYPAEVAHRQQLYAEFQSLFARELPAIPLFFPVYAYAVSDPTVGGVQLPQLLVASTRFTTLPDWYVRTERVLPGSAQTRRPTP
jgi:peptide/nickel transport system substrate-binding protein